MASDGNLPVYSVNNVPHFKVVISPIGRHQIDMFHISRMKIKLLLVRWMIVLVKQEQEASRDS